ncbi:hypothetical protein LguiB_002816 [Lonicera macranthoides]
MLVNSNYKEEEEEGDDKVVGALKQFSYLELKSATPDFQVKLGRGGFGSVFEGDLVDGSKVAVKCLESIGQGIKEFLAEPKLIDRDQSQVLTVLKDSWICGPELFSGTNISVKAVVFSFGIEKAENDQLDDLVDDGYNEGIQFQKEEAVEMIKIGIWCLQAHNTRPSISTILKVLEGLMDLGPVSEYCSATTSPIETHLQANSALSTPPVASILSGPR